MKIPKAKFVEESMILEKNKEWNCDTTQWLEIHYIDILQSHITYGAWTLAQILK